MRNPDSTPAKALLLAIARCDRLSPDLQAAVRRLGVAWNSNQPNLNDNIRHLVSQDPQLQHHYHDAYDELEEKYEAQERRKSIGWVMPSETDVWGAIADVLNAENSVAIAQKILQPVNPVQRRPLSEAKFWKIGNRLLVFVYGGAVLGAMVGQVPGALIGGIIAALLSLITTTPTPAKSRRNS